MSVHAGIKIIVNADVVIDGVTPGETYVAQGGLHELPGATIISDKKTVKYLEPSQFEFAHDNDETEDYRQAKAGDERGVDLSRFFMPES